MPVERKKPWFAVKRFGYGVGLPTAWEGWLVLFLYVAAVVSSALLLPAPASMGLFILFTAAVLYICYVRSDDEWRWRGGE